MMTPKFIVTTNAQATTLIAGLCCMTRTTIRIKNRPLSVKTSVNSLMLPAISNNKVLNSVIGFYTVNMVNYFRGLQITTNLFLHYKTMLLNIISRLKGMIWTMNVNISLCTNMDSTLPSTSSFAPFIVTEDKALTHGGGITRLLLLPTTTYTNRFNHDHIISYLYGFT